MSRISIKDHEKKTYKMSKGTMLLERQDVTISQKKKSTLSKRRQWLGDSVTEIGGNMD